MLCSGRTQGSGPEPLIPTYFDGVRLSDSAVARRAFHPQMRAMSSVRDGALAERSIPGWLAAIAKGASTPPKPDAVRRTVIAVDVTGDSAARWEAIANATARLSVRHRPRGTHPVLPEPRSQARTGATASLATQMRTASAAVPRPPPDHRLSSMSSRPGPAEPANCTFWWKSDTNWTESPHNVYSPWSRQSVFGCTAPSIVAVRSRACWYRPSLGA
jgi:hypothetical protein